MLLLNPSAVLLGGVCQKAAAGSQRTRRGEDAAVAGRRADGIDFEASQRNGHDTTQATDLQSKSTTDCGSPGDTLEWGPDQEKTTDGAWTDACQAH